MRALRRIVNGIRKVANGLTPFGESVWPGVRNDLFVAHESIYGYFATFAGDRSVLDAGCGTGYGAAILAEAGARSVTALDIDRRSIRYAARHFRRREVTFAVADLEAPLPLPDASFDAIVSSNCLEHLHHPGAFVDEMRRLLRPDGVAVVAVPPVTSEALAREHDDIHYHHSVLTVTEWQALFEDRAFEPSFVRHRWTRREPDFRALHPSDLTVNDFAFETTTAAGLHELPTITAIFVLRRT